MGGSKSPENPEIPSSGLVSIFLGGQGLDSRKICVFDLENPENPGGSGRFGHHHQGTGLHLESGLVGGLGQLSGYGGPKDFANPEIPGSPDS